MSTMTATTAPTAEVDLAEARKVGLNTGVGLIIICAVGMALTFNNRAIIAEYLSMGWLTLGLLPLVGGYLAAKREQLEGVASAPPGPSDVATAGLSGVFAGGLFALFVVVLGTVGDSLRDVFVQLSPQLLSMLTFERGLATGVMVALVLPLSLIHI